MLANARSSHSQQEHATIGMRTQVHPGLEPSIEEVINFKRINSDKTGLPQYKKPRSQPMDEGDV